MESLNPHEICLLKKVWGNNFDDINGIKNANISEKEVLEYYKVVYKLYNANRANCSNIRYNKQ